MQTSTIASGVSISSGTIFDIVAGALGIRAD